jgi:hypothetical protein
VQVTADAVQCLRLRIALRIHRDDRIPVERGDVVQRAVDRNEQRGWICSSLSMMTREFEPGLRSAVALVGQPVVCLVHGTVQNLCGFFFLNFVKK